MCTVKGSLRSWAAARLARKQLGRAGVDLHRRDDAGQAAAGMADRGIDQLQCRLEALLARLFVPAVLELEVILELPAARGIAGSQKGSEPALGQEFGPAVPQGGPSVGSAPNPILGARPTSKAGSLRRARDGSRRGSRHGPGGGVERARSGRKRPGCRRPCQGPRRHDLAPCDPLRAMQCLSRPLAVVVAWAHPRDGNVTAWPGSNFASHFYCRGDACAVVRVGAWPRGLRRCRVLARQRRTLPRRKGCRLLVGAPLRRRHCRS